jgi:lysyl-tRNA synthetase class I
MTDLIMENMKNAYVLDNYAVFQDLSSRLGGLHAGSSEEDIQSIFYDIGKTQFENMRDWFQICYFVFLGKWEGPRLGKIFKLMGIEKFNDELMYRIALVGKMV